MFSVRRVDLTLALKEGSPATGGGRRGHSVRSALVISEIALTLILSFGCGLLLRSLIAAQNSYPGFDAHRLLALELQLPDSSYKNGQAVAQFYRRLMQDLRSEPGVGAWEPCTVLPLLATAAIWWYHSGQTGTSRSDVPLSLFDIC